MLPDSSADKSPLRAQWPIPDLEETCARFQMPIGSDMRSIALRMMLPGSPPGHILSFRRPIMEGEMNPLHLLWAKTDRDRPGAWHPLLFHKTRNVECQVWEVKHD